MAETSAGSSQVQMIQEAYLAQTQRKRLYGFLMLVIFFFVMVAASIGMMYVMAKNDAANRDLHPVVGQP